MGTLKGMDLAMAVIAQARAVAGVEPEFRVTREPLDMVRMHTSWVLRLATFAVPASPSKHLAAPGRVPATLAVPLLLGGHAALPSVIVGASLGGSAEGNGKTTLAFIGPPMALVAGRTPTRREAHSGLSLAGMRPSLESRWPSLRACSNGDPVVHQATGAAAVPAGTVCAKFGDGLPHPALRAVLEAGGCALDIGIERKPKAGSSALDHSNAATHANHFASTERLEQWA